ncbi:MAG TPA: hypothetical protein ENI07_00870 [Desulfobacterales bacterium]|nr:hypothetical protein [Desulfobacterales bacterium]
MGKKEFIDKAMWKLNFIDELISVGGIPKNVAVDVANELESDGAFEYQFDPREAAWEDVLSRHQD